ncbi:MAG: 3-deoxy-D-manno-octulosonic acid transferase [Prevotella sp.]|nr:3-deoxy-D-manno-octulosonic acid transferase [Prevotella sp.]
MYNIAMYFVQLGIAIAAIFDHKVRVLWRGQRAAFKTLKQKVDPNAKYVWVHAASLGEFEQGRPIIERIRLEHPEYKILLTFFSPSGYQVRKNYQGADIITYLPIDTVTNARRFLRTIRPVMAFFIKYEFWYNYLHILKHRNVPTYSVSSIFRPDQIFFRWYGRAYSRVLKCFTKFFVQNEESRQLLAKIGIKETEIVGDTRFDRVMTIKSLAKQLPIVEAFTTPHQLPRGGEPAVQEASPRGGLEGVFVAGSSWPPDEEIFIRYFNEHREWKLIIAPHVIGEDHLQQIISRLSPSGATEGSRRIVRFTQTTREEAAKADTLIIDCFGLLSSIYNYGDVAYIGGGFGVGIHNTLEAAVWDMPVIFGPNNKKFQEAQGLKACGGGFEIKDYDEFAALMQRFATDESFLKQSGSQAGHFVKDQAGATDKVLDSVKL